MTDTTSADLIARLRAMCRDADAGLEDGDAYPDWYEPMMEAIRALTAREAPGWPHHKLDTDRQVFFYEQDFYVLSNFSAFEVDWSGFTFKTAEHLYHWMRFTLSDAPGAQWAAAKVKDAKSAHDAFKLAQQEKALQVSNWDDQKVNLMREILRQKAAQHEYVRRKLLATGDRELIEDSWRDDFWGWGPNRDGKNMLGKLWMEVRAELRAAAPQPKEG